MKQVWINMEPFIKLSIFNATSRVMHKLLLLAVKEDNIYKVYLNTNIREQILKDCNIPKSSYCRAIKELEDCKFLSKDKDNLILHLPKDLDLPVIFKR